MGPASSNIRGPGRPRLMVERGRKRPGRGFARQLLSVIQHWHIFIKQVWQIFSTNFTKINIINVTGIIMFAPRKIFVYSKNSFLQALLGFLI